MKILSRYIALTITGTTLIVVVALLGMDFFIELLHEFADVGKGEYTLRMALEFVLYIIPRDLYLLFPMAGLIGVMLGLGILASNSELVVMRASSLSIAQISFAVMFAVISMVAVITFIGEGLAPYALHHADMMKSLAKSSGQAVSTQHGLWLREGNNFIHIEKVARGGGLEGISRYEFDDQHQLLRSSRAKSAVYRDDHWELLDVQQSHVSELGVKSQYVDKSDWLVSLNPEVLKVAQEDPEEMSLKKLYQIMQYKKQNSLEYADYALPFWRRVFQPLATCVMMFLAIPFIFGPLRTVTMGFRLVMGLIVGFSFYILNQFFGPFSMVFQFPPILAALFPTILFSGVAFYIMQKSR